jgi:tRNA G18 (ribose-2'-O)-methylase SpoU
VPNLILIIDSVRSAYNVGALFRSADAFGVSEIICTGITPYPKTKEDSRLPHVSQKAHGMITKTGLGAETTVPFRHMDIDNAIAEFFDKGYKIYALEQAPKAIAINSFKPQFPCVLIVGNELAGVSKSILKIADQSIEIPMFGQKESLNVSVAAGIALFYFNSFGAK